ncbi:MAG: hypothetical protein DHS20C20_28810 [Ardenticatenaceae bacterium]|nr:MAG: hypothetical protein DHS20C20_28810 [Ardenticatenaceae bacterium]
MSPSPAKKKNSIFSKIENRVEALKVIKESSIAFIVIGIIQGAVGFFLFPTMLVDAALNIVLGLILMFAKSRIAAVLLLLLAGASVVTTFLNRLGVIANGGTNIFLAIIIFWTAIKAVEATFKLHGKFAQAQSVGDSTFEIQTPEMPEQPNSSEPRFATGEWALIGLVILLVVIIVGVVLIMIV